MFDRPRYGAQYFADAISAAKSAGQTVQTYLRQSVHQYKCIIGSVWNRYNQYLRSIRGLDFTDLLIVTAELLRKFPEASADVDAVIVDEFQDVVPIMYQLTKMLLQKETFLTVIGDPNQSIYGFAGAMHLVMQTVQMDFDDVAVINLNRSYRCSREIMEASEMVLFNDTERITEAQTTTLFAGTKVVRMKVENAARQAEVICKSIREYVENSELEYKDFAVAFRTHMLVRDSLSHFKKEQVPCELLQNKWRSEGLLHLSNLLALLVNPYDAVAFSYVMQAQYRTVKVEIGVHILNYLAGDADEKNRHFAEVMAEARMKATTDRTIKFLLEKFEINIPAEVSAQKLHLFSRNKSLREVADALTILSTW